MENVNEFDMNLMVLLAPNFGVEMKEGEEYVHSSVGMDLATSLRTMISRGLAVTHRFFSDTKFMPDGYITAYSSGLFHYAFPREDQDFIRVECPYRFDPEDDFEYWLAHDFDMDRLYPPTTLLTHHVMNAGLYATVDSLYKWHDEIERGICIDHFIASTMLQSHDIVILRGLVANRSIIVPGEGEYKLVSTDGPYGSTMTDIRFYPSDEFKAVLPA